MKIINPTQFIEYVKQNRWASHLAFWMAIDLGFILRHITEQNQSLLYAFIDDTLFLVPQMLFSYLLAYCLIPKFYSKKKYFTFFILLASSAYIISAFGRMVVVHFIEPIIRTPPFPQESLVEILSDWKKLVLEYMPLILFVAIIFLFTRLSFRFSKIKQQALELKKEKTASELKMLKAQLNPHFLFNTLNNIYSLSLDNNPKASESIGILSEILDYMLYGCNKKLVPISNEIRLLENYIALEKLRYDERLKISFNNTIKSEFKIAPLILISLVENAFKHGAGEDSGSPTINIFLSQKQNHFKFEISNTTASPTQKGNRETIGLNNIKKQLDVIYPKQYRLNITEEGSLFKVILILKTPLF